MGNVLAICCPLTFVITDGYMVMVLSKSYYKYVASNS